MTRIRAELRTAGRDFRVKSGGHSGPTESPGRPPVTRTPSPGYCPGQPQAEALAPGRRAGGPARGHWQLRLRRRRNSLAGLNLNLNHWHVTVLAIPPALRPGLLAGLLAGLWRGLGLAATLTQIRSSVSGPAGAAGGHTSDHAV
jgi:hypothetical protein